jgi:hypothetical protein
MSQSEGREEASSRRGRLGARATGGDATHSKGTSRWETCEKKGSSQRTKKKRIKKTHQVAAASHLAFVSGKAQRARNQEKGRPPSGCEREGVLVHL